MLLDDCISKDCEFTWPFIVIFTSYPSQQSEDIIEKVNIFTKLCCNGGANIRIIYSDNKYQDFEYYVE